MNLIGKIFTVLIFVMSILFMGFAVAVYATHQNWKLVVDNPDAQHPGLSQRLDQADSRNEELRHQKTKLEADLAFEQKAREDVQSALETKLDVLQRKHTQLQQQLAKLKEAERKAVVLANRAEERLKALDVELQTLRTNITDARQDRDANFKRVVAITDDLHQAVNELKRLKALQVRLADDRAKVQEVLRIHGLKDDPAAYRDVPPAVEGIVLAVTGEGLVEVSIGSDDGLLKKHTLEVFRARGTGGYVGRIEVIETHPDRAVCKIDPKYLKSPMRKGDRVASKQALK